jgi:hypothetical protein
MIKAVGKNPDGTPMILLGISAKNVELLKEGKPMLVSLKELGLEGNVAIFYGETEESMEQELQEQFSIGTKRDDRPDSEEAPPLASINEDKIESARKFWKNGQHGTACGYVCSKPRRIGNIRSGTYVGCGECEKCKALSTMMIKEFGVQ